MVKQKYRTLVELYSVTEPILELEITPVLRGSCRMQGPVSETDEHSCSDKVLSQAGNEAGCHSMRHKSPRLAESGTCNLCSAPCSSCLDLNRNHKRLKTCHKHAESQYSANGDGSYSLMKSRECAKLQRTFSETSNVLSATSSHDSFSDNAVNKASLKYSDISCASEDVEMCPKSELVDVPNMAELPNKFESIKRIECRDDESSSASGANDANIMDKHNGIRVHKDNVPCSSTSACNLVPLASSDKVCSKGSPRAPNVEDKHRNLRRQNSYVEDSKPKVSFLSAPIAKQFGPSYPVSKEDTGCSSPKVHSTYSHSLTCIVKEELSSICKKKRSDLSVRNVNSSLRKEGDLQNNERSPLGGSSEVCRRVDPNSEAEINHSSGYVGGDAPICSGGNEQAVTSKLDDETELHDSVEPRLQSISDDKNDESDVVEVDVNICDICGDAGREYLLALCSKCGDGAEHTYCMREKLEEVPKGDWLCEECKPNAEGNNKKREVEAVNGSAKKRFSGYTRSVRSDLYVRLNSKDIAVDTRRIDKFSPSAHSSRKRPFDSLDTDSRVKRLVLEKNAVSPKVQTQSRTTSLAKDSLYMNPDQGKSKLARQMSFVPTSTSPRFQTARGSLLKYNSFNSFNGKPRAVADGVIHHKQKPTRELESLKSKERRLNLMRRSISLKAENSVRSSAFHSNDKMLSPRFPHSRDIKGLGNEKDLNTLERKKSFKLDDPVTSLTRSSSSVSARQGDKYFTSRVDQTAGLQRASKHEQAEAKLTSSNPTRSLARKALEIPGGAVSSKGIHGAASAEEISNLVSPKKEAMGSSSHNTKKLSRARDVDTMLSFSRESENQVERTGDNLTPRPRQEYRIASPRSPRVDPSQARSSKDVVKNGSTLKDALHAARTGDNLTPRPRQEDRIASPRSPHVDPSHARSSKDAVNNGSTLKDALHAARTGDNSTPRPRQEDRIASPRSPRVDPSYARSSKDAVNNGSTLKDALHAAHNKKPGIYKNSRVPADQSGGVSLSKTDSNSGIASQEKLVISSTSKSIHTGELEGNPIVMGCISDTCQQTEVSKQVTVYPTDHVMSAFLQTVPIPEHEYIWQGDFEVLRNGKTLELCAGIQAHLSTCASPRVLEAVNKFASRVPLAEVSRKSIWPAQFHDGGPREDHIALYFFAKDVVSFDVNYTSLLNTMMRNDVALKGIIDGVELLIFSSNHLPKKSQRWNTLFFLWGVFRAKVSCSDDMPDHSNLDIVRLDKELPTAVTSVSKYSPSCTDQEMKGRDKICNLVPDSHTNGSLGIVAGNDEFTPSTPSSLGNMLSGSQGMSEQPDTRLNSQTSSGAQTYSKQLHTASEHLQQQPDTVDDCKLEVELLPPTQERLSPVITHTTSLLEVDLNVDANTEKVTDRLSDADHMKTEKCIKIEEGSGTNKFPEKYTEIRHFPPKEDRKYPLFSAIASQASPDCKSEEPAIKKLKVEQTQSSKSDSCINLNALPEDSGTSCLRNCTEELDLNVTITSEDLTLSEREFFATASHPVKESQTGHCSSLPWVSNGPHHNSLRNPDLALWVNTKSPKKETPVLPLFPDTPKDRQNNPQEDDNASVSLSLSPAFPFAENKRDRHGNTPLLLFKDFPNK